MSYYRSKNIYKLKTGLMTRRSNFSGAVLN